MSKYNTNLASEFLIMSILHRLGFEAYLSLGNKKSVDIMVLVDDISKTIDVKGLSGKTTYRLPNLKKIDKSHYFVFVSFKDEIKNIAVIPDIFVVPSIDIPILFKQQKNQSSLYISTLKNANKYFNNWELLTK